MAGLSDMLENYRNWRGRQEWESGKGWQDFYNGDPVAQERFEKWSSGFGTGSHGVGGLAGIVSREGLGKVLEDIAAKGIDIEASANPSLNRITLSKLIVPKAMRGEGIGSQAMQDLGRYADQEQALVQLTPSKDYGASSLKRLIDFYKNLGYEQNVGPSRDLSLTESMYRTPLDTNYKGEHSAPLASDATAPLHDLAKIYPDDVYGSNAWRYYGHGSDEMMDREIMSKLQRYKDKPDELVKVFRAVPADVFRKGATTIKHGDWVSPSRAYAVEHGESALNGDYKIVYKNVPAKSLFTDANSPYEFGYDESVIGK